jgi:hypothetical protein
MLSPADLLKMAEIFAGRIPVTAPFEEERQVSWTLVGNGYLRAGDADGALRAMRRLSAGEPQAELRLAFATWTSEHPDSDAGRQLVRETVDEISSWEQWFHRRDFRELTPIVCRLLGENAVRQIVDGVEDAFTKVTVLTTWANLGDDATLRRTLLAEGERVAAEMDSGNRDWALRCVLRGYQSAGLDAGAERVLGLMERNPETMDAPISHAESLLAQVHEMFPAPEPSPDSPDARLIRFLNYRYNELKVRWLTEQASQGGLDNSEMEAHIGGEAFQRIEAQRQPGIHKDPSALAPADFAAFFFDRPVPLLDTDREILDGDSRYSTSVDSVALVRAVTVLCSNFGALTQSYSQDQIERGLWFLFGYPYFFFNELVRDEVEEEMRVACLEAMLVPFRDYYQNAEDYDGSAFYMWWDHFRGWEEKTLPVCRGVLERILALPHKGCQIAALHGLNHLCPDVEASAMIERYLERCRSNMAPDEIEYAKACRDGLAQ